MKLIHKSSFLKFRNLSDLFSSLHIVIRLSHANREIHDLDATVKDARLGQGQDENEREEGRAAHQSGAGQVASIAPYWSAAWLGFFNFPKAY